MKISYIVRFNEMEAELASRSAAPILPKDYPAALRALADAEEKRLRIEQTLAVEQPKARVYDVTFADRQLTLAKFCRRLRGVNTNNVRKDLYHLSVLYRQGGSYRPLRQVPGQPLRGEDRRQRQVDPDRAGQGKAASHQALP